MTQQQTRTIPRSTMIHLLFLGLPMTVQGYASSLSVAPNTFNSLPPVASSTNPFKREGLNLELPDFSHLFDKIQQVSPLARKVISGENPIGMPASISSDQSKSIAKVGVLFADKIAQSG